MMSRKTTNQRGFTLIELLIATTVFTIILLIATATLIQVGRLYYKGIITSKTQGVARSVIDSVTRSIQFSNGDMQEVDGSQIDNHGVSEIQVRCFGNTRFTYVPNAQVSDKIDNGVYADGKIRHALWQDTLSGGGCDHEVPIIQFEDPYQFYPGAADRHSGRSLLDNNMRLQKFDITNITPPDLFRVNVKISYYADPSLVDNPSDPQSCKGTVVGGQWCAISDLTSVVYSRAK